MFLPYIKCSGGFLMSQTVSSVYFLHSIPHLKTLVLIIILLFDSADSETQPMLESNWPLIEYRPV